MPDDDASSIVMVNGSLMAKSGAELFQQAVNYLFSRQRPLGSADRQV
ncbi:MAG: hypothetical protein WB760_12350 [Xanthobacteraceae bacterium]